MNLFFNFLFQVSNSFTLKNLSDILLSLDKIEKSEKSEKRTMPE